MKLQRVRIAGYKNLIDTSIEFSDEQVPLAIIGNNGTGKSNLIEALLHIFVGLFYDDPPDFSFDIDYEAHGNEVSIERDAEAGSLTIRVAGEEMSRTRFKQRARKPDLNPPFPSLVFGYYSGTCERVQSLFQRYRRTYASMLRRQSRALDQSFAFSTIEQAERVLVGLFAHRYDRILEAVNIREFGDTRIYLRSPETFDPDKHERRFWNTEGAVREFLADIENYAFDSTGEFTEVITDTRLAALAATDPFRDRSEFTRTREDRSYVIKPDGWESIGRAVERRRTTVYSMLEHLHRAKLLTDIKYELVHVRSGSRFAFDGLSEGEKQLVSVIGGLALARQDECLVLLDEPDTHLNPSWSWEYYDLIRDALAGQQRTRSCVLLATHDPVMISGLTADQVLIAKLSETGALGYEQPVRDPRGQGIANILCSEYFGLPSSLDKATQLLLDRRLELQFQPGPLSEDDRRELASINDELEYLGPSIAVRDAGYAEYLRRQASPETTT